MSEISKYLQLIHEQKYPLIEDFPTLNDNPWEVDLLYSRKTSKPELQTLLDHHLISIIWATRFGEFNPREFAKREVDYRVFYDFPPTTRFFEKSMMHAYDDMIKEAEEQGLQEKGQFLVALKEQFGQILSTTGWGYEGEMGTVLRDVLSACQRYYPND